jgi:hypothetical protein
MTDEQLEAGIEAITAMLAARADGANAKVIQGVSEPVPALPAPRKARRKTTRKRRKSDEVVGGFVDQTEDKPNS